MSKETSKEKQTFKQVMNDLKSRFNDHNERLKEAGEIGFSSGVKDGIKMPNGFGTEMVAIANYSKGLKSGKNRKKSDKYFKD